jgi:Zn-dependent metalloprotease
MNNNSLKIALVSAALLFGLTALPARAASENMTSQAAPSHRISLLNDQLKLSLPKGFEISALPPGTTAKDPSARGALYINKANQQLIVMAETPAPTDQKANSRALLAKVKADFYARQRLSGSTFKVLKEKIIKRDGLTVQQLDTTSVMNGTPMRSTSFIVEADARVAVVQLLSDRKDEAAHSVLVQHVLGDH